MKMTLTPKLIVEVGTGPLRVCKTSYYAGDNETEVWMFDPIKQHCDEIDKFVKSKYPHNVKIFNCCLYDYDGKINIYEAGESSTIEGIAGPNNLKDKKTISVDCYRMSKFDNGNIDVLFLDTEGSEWFILKHLLSRPTVIVVETQMEDGHYINPYINEISQWMKINNYMMFKQSNSDSVFVRKNLLMLQEDNNYDMSFKLKTFGL